MAKKASVTVSIDRNLLSLIAAASAANSVYMVSQAEAGPLMAAGYIEVDTSKVADGKAPARITVAGATYLNGSNGATAQASVQASPFQVFKGAVLPASKRGSGLKGGGAPKQYPFDTMEVGDNFFVPVSAKHPNPVKQLGSTVSSANLRYAEVIGTEMKTRNKRGKKNKLVLDAAGNPIPEQVESKKYKYTRRWAIRPVVAGVVYGGWTADANGALIQRTE